MNNYEEDDLSIELEASSMQITNFNKSFEIESATDLKNNKSPSIKPKQNLSNDSPISLSSNIKDNKTFEETENKNRKRTFELQRENEELKNKLKLYENKSPSTLNKDEAKRINEENLKLIEELEDFKAKVLIRIINIYDVYIIIQFDKKNREVIDYKTKYDSLQFDYEIIEKKISDYKQQVTNFKNETAEKDDTLNFLKQDLKKKEELIQNQTGEILNYQNQIEKIKVEFTAQRSEITKKAEKITEFQQRIFLLEQEILVKINFYYFRK